MTLQVRFTLQRKQEKNWATRTQTKVCGAFHFCSSSSVHLVSDSLNEGFSIEKEFWNGNGLCSSDCATNSSLFPAGQWLHTFVPITKSYFAPYLDQRKSLLKKFIVWAKLILIFERNDHGTKWPDTLLITINYDTINNKQQRKIVPKDFLRLVWGENKRMRLSFV